MVLFNVNNVFKEVSLNILLFCCFLLKGSWFNVSVVFSCCFVCLISSEFEFWILLSEFKIFSVSNVFGILE